MDHVPASETERGIKFGALLYLGPEEECNPFGAINLLSVCGQRKDKQAGSCVLPMCSNCPLVQSLGVISPVDL